MVPLWSYRETGPTSKWQRDTEDQWLALASSQLPVYSARLVVMMAESNRTTNTSRGPQASTAGDLSERLVPLDWRSLCSGCGGVASVARSYVSSARQGIAAAGIGPAGPPPGESLRAQSVLAGSWPGAGSWGCGLEMWWLVARPPLDLDMALDLPWTWTVDLFRLASCAPLQWAECGCASVRSGARCCKRLQPGCELPLLLHGRDHWPLCRDRCLCHGVQARVPCRC